MITHLLPLVDKKISLILLMKTVKFKRKVIETELPTAFSEGNITVEIHYINERNYGRFERKYLKHENLFWRIMHRSDSFRAIYETSGKTVESGMLFKIFDENIGVIFLANNDENKKGIIGRAAELEYRLIESLIKNGWYTEDVDDNLNYFKKKTSYTKEGKKHICRQYKNCEPNKMNVLVFYLDYTMYKNIIEHNKVLDEDELYDKTLKKYYSPEEFERYYFEMERNKTYLRRLNNVRKKRRLYEIIKEANENI